MAAGINQFALRHFFQKAARLAGCPVLAALAPVAVADLQAALGARDADIHQAAFFLDLFFVAVAERQDVFFRADDEHMREFKPLGGVQRG